MPVNLSIYQSEQGRQGVGSFTKMNKIMGSLIFVLLALVELKYENKAVTPFETNSPVMMLFIVTMLINTLVAAAAIKVQAWFTNHILVPALCQICIAAEFLACGFLLLILAPPFGYFFIVMGVLLLFPVLFYYLFTLVLRRLPHKVKAIFQRRYGFLPQATSQASAASPTSFQQQDGLTETTEYNNGIHVGLTVP